MTARPLGAHAQAQLVTRMSRQRNCAQAIDPSGAKVKGGAALAGVPPVPHDASIEFRHDFSWWAMISEELRKARLQRAKAFADGTPPVDEQIVAVRKKAGDLDALQKAVTDAASVGAPLWISYIFMMFYIAIAAGAVTHVDLLLERPIKLPFLGVELALKAFFIVAPFLFLVVHAYVLAHFVMLAEKAKAFHKRLTAKLLADSEHDVREGLRHQLPINVFVQFLAGPGETRESAFGVMLWVIAWVSLVGAPVLVLLLLQVQFLPYHDTRVTWAHRVVICVDLATIWWLWMKILDGRDRSKPQSQNRWMRYWDIFLLLFRGSIAPLASGIVVVFALGIATFPGEWSDWPVRFPIWIETNIASATEKIFGKVDALNRDEHNRVAGNWPVNTLRLREFDLYNAIGVDGPDKLKWKTYNFSLKNRRLEHADLRSARLDNIDLRGASLTGALLQGAKMRGACLDEALLIGAQIDEAQLQGASLVSAMLQGSSLAAAELHGAQFIKANLLGASLFGAQLQGASLDEANLQATFLAAELQAASFSGAHLQGAWLWGARLDGASFYSAELQGASLNGAFVGGTAFDDAFFWRSEGAINLLKNSSISIGRAKWGPIKRREGKEEPWSHQDYKNVYRSLKILPNSELRDVALKRIAKLDCSPIDQKNDGCDFSPSSQPALRKQLERWAAGAWQDQAKEVAKRWHDLVCEANPNAIYILRGLLRKDHSHTPIGLEKAAFVDGIMNVSCGVYHSLTDADIARLLELKSEDTSHVIPIEREPQNFQPTQTTGQ